MTAALFSPRGLWRALTSADRALALLLLLGFAFVGLVPRGGGAKVAIVSVGRSEVARLALTAPGTYPIEGRQGPVVLEVRHGAVRVLESSCAHGICRAMGEKNRAGEILACVPNGVLVRLEGGAADPDAPDSVSR